MEIKDVGMPDLESYPDSLRENLSGEHQPADPTDETNNRLREEAKRAAVLQRQLRREIESLSRQIEIVKERLIESAGFITT